MASRESLGPSRSIAFRDSVTLGSLWVLRVRKVLEGYLVGGLLQPIARRRSFINSFENSDSRGGLGGF